MVGIPMDDGRNRDSKVDQGNTEEATERRFNQTVRNLLNTPHKPHKGEGKPPPKPGRDSGKPASRRGVRG
jgi:hypothetical protein